MLIIKGEKVLLRDYIHADIDDYIRWNTVSTEWMDWDAPWETDDDTFDQEAYKSRKIKDLTIKKDDKKLRTRLEISLCNEGQMHIGWVNCYQINHEYEFTTQKGKIAIGIDIPETHHRGNGYGREALTLYIKYLKSKNVSDIYLQTWSGNKKMLNLAKKLGFIECHRTTGNRVVKGELYDAMTLKLRNKE